MTFYSLLAQALADLASRGYVSASQVDAWLDRMRNLMDEALGPAEEAASAADVLEAKFRNIAAKVKSQVPGLDRYTIAMVAPHLRAELDRRIMAAADLIKLHREQAIAETMRRFQGWATSIPAGGIRDIDKRAAKASIGKAYRQMPFERRRVLIDQAAKLSANVADIVAKDAGAIAAIWLSQYQQQGYKYRPEHKARHGKIYAIRDNWALVKGLMNKGSGYTDESEVPAELPFCQCKFQYITSLRDLPDSMLTRAGQETLAALAKPLAA